MSKDTYLKLIRPGLAHNYFQTYLCYAKFNKLLCHRFGNIIFVFGDNVLRTGQGGQAVIRPCKNSVGIRTKKSPTTLSGAYFYDRDFDQFCEYIDADFQNLEELRRHHPIALSAYGYGNGLADLPNRAPQCYNYLIHKLNRFIGTEHYRYIKLPPE